MLAFFKDLILNNNKFDVFVAQGRLLWPPAVVDVHVLLEMFSEIDDGIRLGPGHLDLVRKLQLALLIGVVTTQWYKCIKWHVGTELSKQNLSRTSRSMAVGPTTLLNRFNSTLHSFPRFNFNG